MKLLLGENSNSDNGFAGEDFEKTIVNFSQRFDNEKVLKLLR